MYRIRLFVLTLAAVALICWVSPIAYAVEGQFTGVVIGRVGEFLQISVPQPVPEGVQFGVKLMEDERPIADVKVISCTEERPFVALAKVVRKEFDQTIPIGVRAYADPDTLEATLPRPKGKSGRGSGDRFSLQAGAFYPSEAETRDSTDEYWQSYRLSYSMMRIKGLETVLSIEYGKTDAHEGDTSSTIEIVPVTILGKIHPLRFGKSSVFVAAGAGVYGIRSTPEAAARSDRTEMGLEYALGLETGGWVAELRYRDVENTNIKGYSFALGTRF